MAVSKCCHAKIFVEGSNEGTNYYVCTQCKKPTDPWYDTKEVNKMTDFNIAVEYVLKNEGGLANDTHDAGGITNFGISFRFLKEIKSESVEDDIIHMTREQAMAIYHDEFWTKAPYGKILNQNVCNYIFDQSVSMGLATSIKITQRALRSFTRNTNIQVDGVLGNMTLDDINHAGYLLMPPLRAQREAEYRLIAEKNPNDAKFLDGWVNRSLR